MNKNIKKIIVALNILAVSIGGILLSRYLKLDGMESFILFISFSIYIIYIDEIATKNE